MQWQPHKPMLDEAAFIPVPNIFKSDDRVVMTAVADILLTKPVLLLSIDSMGERTFLESASLLPMTSWMILPTDHTPERGTISTLPVARHPLQGSIAIKLSYRVELACSTVLITTFSVLLFEDRCQCVILLMTRFCCG